jgi:hypothetical protein
LTWTSAARLTSCRSCSFRCAERREQARPRPRAATSLAHRLQGVPGQDSSRRHPLHAGSRGGSTGSGGRRGGDRPHARDARPASRSRPHVCRAFPAHKRRVMGTAGNDTASQLGIGWRFSSSAGRRGGTYPEPRDPMETFGILVVAAPLVGLVLGVIGYVYASRLRPGGGFWGRRERRPPPEAAPRWTGARLLTPPARVERPPERGPSTPAGTVLGPEGGRSRPRGDPRIAKTPARRRGLLVVKARHGAGRRHHAAPCRPDSSELNPR